MERLTYDFVLGGNHCWQVKGADNLECREVCERQGDDGCKTCPIAKAFDRLAAYEDTGLEPEEVLPKEYAGKIMKSMILLKEYQSIGSIDRLRELAQADREGRCVVLPVPLHKTLLDTSDPYRPELMKDFRISATWTHRGIVFHSPWDIFLENIESGYIRVISAEAEAALRREQDGE